MKLRVEKYFPDRLYGFIRDDQGDEVFFHVGAFDPSQWDQPPPIAGEWVEAEVGERESANKAPRASSVKRLDEPRFLTGTVESFNPDRGWGFAKGSDDTSYYLHRSEVVDGKLPMKGMSVTFYAGFKKDRPRACYVTVESRK